VSKAQPVEISRVPEEHTDEEKSKLLPEPVGYKILCAVPEVEATFDGTSIERPQVVVDQEKLATVVLFVLRMGKECYSDKSKYPEGAWCKIGDFVLARQYSGTRFKIYGKEFRLLNDDQIEAVVKDPRGISRA